MQIGLLTLGDWVADPTNGARVTEAQRHRSIVDQAVAAEAAGFVSVHLGEHHFSDYILSAPAVVLAAIAERTTTLRLSNGVALAGTNDPVRVAEDYATVDVLSNGRVEPCFGRGSIYPDVYTFFGQSADEATARFGENVRLIDQLWRADGPITWRGEFRADLVDVEVRPQPVQRPRPSVWLGGGWSPDTVDLAIELGYWLMLPTVIGTWDMFVPVVERYIEGWEAAGRDPADRRIGCCSHFHVGADSGAARQRWEQHYLGYLGAVDGWIEQSARRAGKEAGALPVHDFDTMISTIAICGSPAEVVDRMGVAAEMLHLDTQILMMDPGGLPEAEVLASIDLAGAEVLPQVAAG